MYWLAVVCTTLVILEHVEQVAGITCDNIADKKFGPVCPFDCSNCGAVTCRYSDYVCVGGYCAAVDGPAGPQGCAFEDIARGGKKMAQMSTYNDIGPYRASNRLYATNALSTCTHTNTGVSYPWWRVDFGSKHVVYAVQLYNRIHSTALDRLCFFDIRVGDTDIQTAITAGQKFTGNPLCKAYNQRVPETLTTDVKPYAEILCDQPRRGRYLSIQMNEGNGISRSSKYNNVLTICEISIRGYKDFGSGGRTGNGDCWCRDGSGCDMAGVCNSGCKLGRYGKYCHNVVALETPTLSAYSPTTVNVQWKLFNSVTFIDSNRGSVTLSYRVQYKSGSGAWRDFPGQGSIIGSGANQLRALKVTGLRADTQYQIRSVLVKTYNGKAEMAAHSAAVTRCGVPTLVTNIRLSTGCDGADKASITVIWQASSYVRCGTGRVQYVVWVKEGLAGSGTFGTHNLQNSGYTIRNLKQDTLYTVRVEARNSAYPGLKSLADKTHTTTIWDLSAPENVELSTSYSIFTGTWPNQARISVTWKRPANAGCGTPRYRVTYGLSGATGETIFGLDATSHTLLNLVPYTEYEVTVTIISGIITADAPTKTIRTAEGQSSPVTDIKFSATSATSTTVSWTKPAKPYGIITKYVVTYRRTKYLVSGATVNCPAGSDRATSKTVFSGTPVKLTGLKSNAGYNIAVVPYTNGGSRAGIGSNVNVDTLPAALPKPSQIQASPLYDGNLPHPNQCKATVNWAADIGNDCMVLQFRVDYEPATSQATIQSELLAGVTRSFIISSLKCYTDYEVRVVALKGSAESESEPYDFKTPEGKPDAVSSLTITPSPNSAVLSWSAPTPHGVLSQYEITYRRVRYLTADCSSNDQTKYRTVAAGTTSYTVTGLSSYSEYLFSVTAYTNNNQNKGLTTWQTKETTAKALPKPSQIRASPLYDGTLPHPNQCKATVNWAVDIGNDCMVLQFRVEYTPTNGQKISSRVLSGVTRSLIISSLKCYTDYKVRVVALKGSAESESEPYDFKTPEGKPDRVSSLTITPSSNSAVLSWSAPIPHGVLSQYQITYRRVRYLASCQNTDQTKTRTVAAGTTTYTATGLSSHSEYQFSVTAYTNNNQNRGLTTQQSNQTTTKAPPRPTITKIESQYVQTYTYPNTVKITVEWSQPAPGLGECMTITNHVNYRQSGTVLSSSIGAGKDSRVVDITYLTPYTDYEVMIDARNGQGKRSSTGWKPHRTAEGLSGPLTSLSVSPSGTTVDVRWTAPSHPYGVITSYRVSYSRQSYLAGCTNSPGHTGTEDVDPDSHTISGLSPFSQYQVRVAAINRAGPGQESSRAVNTLGTVPDSSAAPTKPVVLDAKTTSATVRFHDISCKQRRGSFKAYNYQLTDLSYGLSSLSGDTSTTQPSLTGLTPFTSYNIRYNWANQKGASAWSEEVEFVTEKSTPPAPTITTVDSGQRYMNVTVEPPYPPYDYLTTVTVTCRRTDNNQEITSKFTIIDNSKEAVVVSFDEVQPSTEYLCTAVVIGSLYRSSIESEKIQVSTKESEATEPREFKAVEITNSSMRLTWTSPKAKNGLILRYQYWCTAVSTKNPSEKESLPTELKFTLEYQYKITDSELTHKTDPINDLWSATQYACQVGAVNGAGLGKIQSGTFWTKAEPVTVPVGSQVNYDPDRSNDSSVHVMLPEIPSPNVEIERYQILVKRIPQNEGSTRRKRSVDRDLTFEEAGVLGADNYTAAEWNDSRDSFLVGDGRNYSDYYNAPLEKGETYDILYRAASVVGEDVEYTEYISLSSHVRVGHYPQPFPVGIVAGSVAGAIFFLLILTAVIIVFVVLSRKGMLPSMPPRARSDSNAKIIDGTELAPVVVVEDRVDSPLPNGEVHTDTPPVTVPRYERHFQPYNLEGFMTTIRGLTKQPRGFTQEYQALPNHAGHYPQSVAKIQENRRKNRYQDIIPYDHNRIVLSGDDCDDDISNYINASYVTDYKGRRSYIASQGPKTGITVDDFWQMIWQEDVRVIVMATDCFERGREKCAEYWPTNVGASLIYGNYEVEHQSTTEVNENVKKRQFVISKDGTLRTITQFQYVGWPDHGVPALCAPILRLRAIVREAIEPDTVTLVHCSAGVGRTGTFMAVDDCLSEYNDTKKFNIKETLTRFRHFRERTVQTDRQYAYVYHCLLEALALPDTDVPKHEFIDRVNKHGISEREFEILEIFRGLDMGEECQGRLEENIHKNRFPDIIPDDYNRAALTKEMAGRNLYLNACYMDNLSHSPSLLATQMTLEHTILELWRLVRDYSITLFVRMDGDHVDDPNERYWPLKGSMSVPPFTIEFKNRENLHKDYSLETFAVTFENNTWNVRMLVFHGWPGSALTLPPLQAMINLYQALKQQQGESRQAVIVQCFNGATKSGLLGATYSLLDTLQVQDTISVFKATRIIHTTRPQFIPDMEHYSFLHSVVCHVLRPSQEEEESIYENQLPAAEFADDEDLYENVPRKPLPRES